MDQILFGDEIFVPMDIHTAASIGNEDKVRDFIESYADEKETVISLQNKEGWTPLMYAAQSGSQRVVICLLEEGAATSFRNKKGQSALMLAAMYGHVESVVLLLENNADVEAIDHQNWTALFYAAFAGHRGVVQSLLDKKCRVNLVDKVHSMSPLMLAAAAGHEMIVMDLLQCDAEVSLISQTGETAQSLAAKNGNTKVKNALESHLLLKQGTIPVVDMMQTVAPSSLLAFLEKLGLSKYYPIFESQGIDLKVFWTLTDKDLIDIGLTLLGPRRKITTEITKWRELLLFRNNKEQSPIDKLRVENWNLQRQVTELSQNLVDEKGRRGVTEVNLDKCVQLLGKYIEMLQNISDVYISKRHLRENILQIKEIFLESQNSREEFIYIANLQKNLLNVVTVLGVVEDWIGEYNRTTALFQAEVSKLFY